jgi:hypothetical protein
VAGEEFTVTAVAAGAQGPVEDVEARCEALAAQHHFIEDIGLAAWPDEIIGVRHYRPSTTGSRQGKMPGDGMPITKRSLP